ncbi:MAG: FkbM family methyltransferase [Anaerohalosphaeraceae bacterium]
MKTALSIPTDWKEKVEQHLARGEADSVCRECAARLQAEPADAFAFFSLGRAFLLKNQLKEARTALETAARLEPSNAQIAFFYVWVSSVQGKTGDFSDYLRNRTEEAVRILQDPCLRVYPSCLFEHLLSAASDLAAESPRNWRYFWLMALAAAKLGRTEAAEAACRTVLALNPEFWYARELPKHLRGYYAQNGQDELIERYFAERRPRCKVFVEVGAFDGIHYSNVRRLAERHGWAGLCIEPAEANFEKLRRAWLGWDVRCIRAAVSSRSGTAQLYVSEYPHLPDWGSDVASLDGSQRDRWTKAYGARWRKETVEAKTLTEILEEQGLEDVALLSIDTEGHDLEVLQGLDFRKYRPQLIVVEYGSQRQDILRYVSSHGYSLIWDNRQDLFFADIQPIQGGASAKNYTGQRKEPYQEIQEDVEENLCSLIGKPQDAPLRMVIVGAYLGQEIERFLRRYPRAEIFAFEPNPRTFALLQQRYRSEQRVHCYPFAVSDRKGTMVFYENNLPGTGSLLPLRSGCRGDFGQEIAEQFGIRSQETFPVECIRLDEFEPLKNKPVDLLWCAVQGAELSVLRGARRVLANCSILFLEVWLYAALYEGQARLIDLEGFLAGRGFVLGGIGLDHKFGNGSGNAFWLNERLVQTKPIDESFVRIESIRSQLNPHLFRIGYLPEQGLVKKQRLSPSALVCAERFDLTAKILYGRFYRQRLKSDWGRRVYLAHLKVFNNFLEEDGSGKAGPEAFLRRYDSLLESLAAEGFDPTRSLLPVDQNGTIIDGSHRVAAAYLTGQDVYTAVFDRPASRYNYAWFLQRGLEPKYADAMAYEYCKIKKNTYIVSVFPCAEGREEEIVSILCRYARLVYRKELVLRKNGPFFYIKHAYLGEHWTGSPSDGFRGYQDKAVNCFRGRGPLRVYLIEADSPEAVRSCKQEIRELFGSNKDAVHINDSYEETLRLAGLCFNENSLHFLNHAETVYFESFHRQLQEYRTLLEQSGADPECFCIDGSSVMAAYGIRPARDIDYLHVGYEALPAKASCRLESYNKAAVYHQKPLDEVVFNPENYFYFEGLKFVSLQELFRMKSNRTEPKNRADVPRIRPYLSILPAAALEKPAERRPKIVGLVTARNEEPIIGQCLRLLSQFTDAIVFLDDCSEDRTLEIVRGLAESCRVERILTKDCWFRDEPGDRNRVLLAGREIGGTHFIVLDADEAFTSNFLTDNCLRNMILAMQPGDHLWMNWIALWRSPHQYRRDGSVWTNNYKPFVFCDDGQCSYASDFIHTPRVPSSLRGRKLTLQGYSHGVLHFQFVNWDNLLWKQAWYRCLERIRNPQKPVDQINKLYAPSKDERDLHLEPADPEWFRHYADFDPKVYQRPNPWYERQVRDWLKQYGPEYFQGLDIEDVLGRSLSDGRSGDCLVSAIVSAYNSEEFIRGCLQDLVEQTLFQKGAMEIIVVDSGSRQNERAIVQEFQARYPNIRYVRTEERETVYAAWNRGIRLARGKYITNANTDDRHAPDMLEKLASVLEQNPDVSYVYSHFYITQIPHQTWRNKTPSRVMELPPYSRELLLKKYYCGPQPMWRRDVHEEYGYFDGRLKSSGDYEFALRISQTRKLMLVPEVLGLYYQNPNGIENSSGAGRAEDELIRALYANACGYVRRPFVPESEETAGGIQNPAADKGPHAVSGMKESLRKPLDGSRPRFSLIMRNYNKGPYIRQAIESVLTQTISDWELIIVDDASTDNSVEIIESYLSDPRIRLIRHPVRRGASQAILTGAAAVRAEVFGELDSDDALLPTALERMLEAHEAHPECGFIYSQHILCDQDLKPIRLGFCRPIPPGQTTLEAGGFISAFRTYKRKDYFRTPLHDIELESAEDKDIYHKMEEVTGIWFVPEPLYLIRQVPNSLSLGSHQPASGWLYWGRAKINALWRRSQPAAAEEKRNPNEVFGQKLREALQKDFHIQFLVWLLRENRELLIQKIAVPPTVRSQTVNEIVLWLAVDAPIQQVVSVLKKDGVLGQYALASEPESEPLSSSSASDLCCRLDSTPLVSICMTAYNTERFIRRAIESVLAQTYENFELIIVDDGSTDGTAKTVQSFRDRRIRFFSQPHKNAAAASNRAIREARGDFVMMIDSDDFIGPSYLERMVAFAVQNPGYDYYYPEKLTLVNEAGQPTGIVWKYEPINNSAVLPTLLFARGNSPIPNAGSLKRRALFEKTGLLRELDNVEDFDFLCRCGPQIRFQMVGGISDYFYRRLSDANTVCFQQRHSITVRCLEEMLERYSPEQLCPAAAAERDAYERRRIFWDYVVSIFEKHAETYADRNGELFAQCAEKYRRKRAEILVREGFQFIQEAIQEKNVRQAVRICRDLLSDKTLNLSEDSRQMLQQILHQLEAERPDRELVFQM